MINAYGPTETTVCATHEPRRCTATPVAPIGATDRQHAGRTCWTSACGRSPPGVVGELYVGRRRAWPAATWAGRR